MDKQNFQIILYVVFGFLVVVGFGSLALYGHLKKNAPPSSSSGRSVSQGEKPEILVWGTLDAGKVEPIFNLLRNNSGRVYGAVQYTEKRPESIKDEYIQTVAYSRRVPDLLLLESGEISGFESLLTTIPFGYYPLISVADYQRTFVPATEIFLRSGGFVALPFLADGLVLYYNENLWLRDDLRVLPRFWSDFTTDVYQRIIKKYQNTDEVVVPFGAYGNYVNAPYLLAALLLQAKDTGYNPVSVKDILAFYTKFADPRSSVYGWSESFLNARSMFVGGRLLFYPGFISEYRSLRRANPNLVIGVAPLPQLSDGRAKVVPTKFYTLSVPKKGRSPGVAFAVALDVARIVMDAPRNIFNAVQLSPPIRGYGVAKISPDDSGGEVSAADKKVTEIEEIFIDSVFPARNVPLSSDGREQLLQSVKNIVIGARTTGQMAATVRSLFR